MTNMWPDNFDFETDDICQTLFKPFIIEELEKLRAYDEQRCEGFDGDGNKTLQLTFI